jgi:Glycosyl hydrolase family 26
MIFQGKPKGTTQTRVTTLASSRGEPVGRRTGFGAATAVATAIAAGSLVLSLAFAGAASASTNNPTIQAAALSGLSWASGAYLPADTPDAAASFGTWRGHPLDVVDDWSARWTWQDIVNPSWLYQRWSGVPYTMAFGVAMLPEGVSGVSLQACANGSYNSYWRQFGSVINSYGLGRSIIRLGWEFNGNWYVWSATNPTTWAKCWRQIVTSARKTAPGLQWDWNVNRGVSSGLADPTQAYPGDSYVNMIGVDSYDWWPAATTDSGWQTQLNGKQGLSYWLSFAEAHGKPLSVPEWGNVSTSTYGGGDDPLYVQDMRSFFAANAAHLAFEANFQGGSNSTGGMYLPTTTIPNSASAYQTGF